MLCGIVTGQFIAIGRAEPNAFIAVRPFILFVLILILRRWPVVTRWGAVLAGLALAFIAQIILLSRLGDGFDARSVAIQLMSALLFAGVLEGFVRAGQKCGRMAGLVLTIPLIVALIFFKPLTMTQRTVESWLSPTPQILTKLPPLVVVTGLPIVRGEGDVGDMLSGKASPLQSWRWLEGHFHATPIDFVTPEALAGRGLLLLAQPRALQPRELVSIDDWVRGGGRALVLADPALHWESRYPLGDPRAPLPMSLLDPLMTRWGIRLDQGEAGIHKQDVVAAGRHWRVMMDAVGRFVATGADCQVEVGGTMARCNVGQGKVLLLADADLLADRLWVADGPDGAKPEYRLADNGPMLGAWLDSLAGISRDRRTDVVRWATLDASWGGAIGLAAIPALLALLGGLFMGFWQRSRAR